MILLKSVRWKLPAKTERRQYPFSVPILRSAKKIAFASPVTFLAGENGSGKSTLIEALGCGLRLPAIGSSDVSRDETLSPVRSLSGLLSFEWAHPTRRGFFLRAEDFFGFVKRIDRLKTELKEEKEDFAKTLSGYGRSLAMGAMEGQIGALKARYGESLDCYSHGESFLALFQSRFVPKGLYVLDEPEAPLSPQRQLAFLSLMKKMTAEDCQFVIATHSPVLMAFPGAVIYSLDGPRIKRVSYDGLEHVRFTRDFLKAPERYLRHL